MDEGPALPLLELGVPWIPTLQPFDGNVHPDFKISMFLVFFNRWVLYFAYIDFNLAF